MKRKLEQMLSGLIGLMQILIYKPAMPVFVAFRTNRRCGSLRA
jgi:hypothetical protein